jgi:hypothetical protein
MSPAGAFLRFFSAMDQTSFDFFVAFKATGTPIRVIPTRLGDEAGNKLWGIYHEDLVRPVPQSHYINVVCSTRDVSRLYTVDVPNVAIIDFLPTTIPLALKDYELVICVKSSDVLRMRAAGMDAVQIDPDPALLAPFVRALL